ncbi:MAG TPA: GreA/GreB family elongation factor [Malonomonas sp.]
MNKAELLKQVIHRLAADYQLLLQAAISSHSAATHEENVPDDKYETLALEASYIAQGQANRAQEIKQALDEYRRLELQNFTDESPIRLTALVVYEDEDGKQRRVFLGPGAGGLRLQFGADEVMLITPESPIGAQLIGRQVGDVFELEGVVTREYEVLDVS